ncbi:acyl-CoA dehydrogenase family protein [Saccharopolyspora rosea]|uniref:Acyl-CoA dehydrogenase family protein n=1 Tax=Saccharopolyspora rosea TaxID=524884 RepID=A0ABW3G2F0_9PSEU|nr:acyl-CoA dehydrogenase family protein [Saccharopolyspora rosea]
MRFAFSEEQEELRSTVRRLLDRHGGPHIPPHDRPAPGWDRAVWEQLAGQVGAHGLAIPEHCGGHGFSLLETLIVVEELGRLLVPGPFLGSVVLAAEALLASGDEDACARLLPGIASGERIACLAWADPESPWRVDVSATKARRDGDRWLLDGRKAYVLDAADADVVLVVADADEGPTLFEASEPAVSAPVGMDLTRSLGEVRLDATPAIPVGRVGGAPEVLRRVRDVAAAAVAAEQIGAAERWLWQIVEYCKLRHQFGRPIGSFQALKHRLADCYVAVESARSLSYAASWAVATGDANAPTWAAMAKSHCCEAYSQVAAEGVQLHGGIGITWEHEAHLHLKRAHAAHHLFGSPSRHRARLPLDDAEFG